MKPLSQLLEEYLSKNHRIADQTRKMTERAINYLIDAVGDIGVDTLNFALVEDFQSSLIDRGLKKVSADSYIKTASPVISWAVRRGMLSKNPFDEVQLFRPKAKLHIYSQAETQAILAAAHNDLWRARIMAAVTAGLRRGEICNLVWDDIDFENGMIEVRSHEDTESTWSYQPKGREKRTVPLTCKLNNLLVIRQTQMPLGQCYPFLPEKRYWTLRQRIGSIPERVRVCPDENWTRPFHQILRRAGTKGKFHDLRRTCIKRWSEVLPPEDVQALAGHADYKTTLNYYLPTGKNHLSKARQASIV
jgi:integrase